MRTFAVYQQLTPIRIQGDEHRANIVLAGALKAFSARHAIDIAKTWGRFRTASKLGRHPIVKDTNGVGMCPWCGMPLEGHPERCENEWRQPIVKDTNGRPVEAQEGWED